MELHDEELAIVLSLIDRLNGTRTMLQALTAAVESQPAPVRDAILAEMRALLGAGKNKSTVIGFDRSFPIAWGIARSRLLLRAVACIAMATHFGRRISFRCISSHLLLTQSSGPTPRFEPSFQFETL